MSNFSHTITLSELLNSALSFTEPVSPLVGKTKTLGLVFSTASFQGAPAPTPGIKLYASIQQVESVPRLTGSLLEPFNAPTSPDEPSNYVMTLEIKDPVMLDFLTGVDKQVHAFGEAYLLKDEKPAAGARSGGKRKASDRDVKYFPLVREGYREGSPPCIRIKVIVGGPRETTIYKCDEVFPLHTTNRAEPKDLYELIDPTPGTVKDIVYGKRVAAIIDAQTVWLDHRQKQFGMSVYAKALVVLPDPTAKVAREVAAPLELSDF